MAGSFLIPSVTPNDLLQFHMDHFSKAFAGASVMSGMDHEYQTDGSLQHDESDLGYYSDGCKRTLTDEQIEIFRHSEIQRLLLKQRREAEAAAEMDTEGEEGEEVEEDLKLQAVSITDHKSSTGNTNKPRVTVPKKNREQFFADTEKSRNDSRQQHQETYDRSVSTRRRVRELDDITKQEDVILEY